MGIILALISAASWGTGDFLGGLASRKLHQFQVLLFSTSSSMLLVFLCAFLWGEHFPSVHNIILAVLAGVCGAAGLAALYKGLSWEMLLWLPLWRVWLAPSFPPSSGY